VPARFFQASADLPYDDEDADTDGDAEAAKAAAGKGNTGKSTAASRRRNRINQQRRRRLKGGGKQGGVSIQPQLNALHRDKFVRDDPTIAGVLNRPVTAVTGDVCEGIFTSNDDISLDPSVVETCHATITLAGAGGDSDARGRGGGGGAGGGGTTSSSSGGVGSTAGISRGRDLTTGLLLTVADAGIVSGDIFTFTDLRDFADAAAAEAVAVDAEEGAQSPPPPHLRLLSLASAAVSAVYNSMLLALYQRMDEHLHRRLTIHGCDAAVDLLRDFGVQSYRVFSAYEKRHEDAVAALKHFSMGRHCGFVCDRCGGTDFDGVRYKCETCDDFDLCARCQYSIVNQGKPSDCRYKYSHERKQWIMVKGYNEHKKEHHMHRVVPIPGVLRQELKKREEGGGAGGGGLSGAGAQGKRRK
jgi:hypothetical protein